MSHSNSFGGILGPLVESLERKSRQPGRLLGQDVVMTGKATGVVTVVAMDAGDNIHLLISPAPVDDTRFSKLDLKGLKVENHEWSVAGHPAQDYLDVSCATGTLPAFRRPFLRFAEDVLFEISESGDTPSDAVYRTGVRWKRFWSADESAEVTVTWLHGLAGELSFLSYLIEKFGQGAVLSWYGPEGKDHDFQSGTELAVEVKASAEMPLKINCNIRQLDTSIFKKLYIVCYRVAAANGGITLPSLVNNIEGMINDDHILDSFHRKLASAGYTRQAEQKYNEHPVEINYAGAFPVDDAFPKISENSFVAPPDHRISDIRYTLLLTGIEAVTLEDLQSDLQRLSNEEIS